MSLTPLLWNRKLMKESDHSILLTQKFASFMRVLGSKGADLPGMCGVRKQLTTICPQTVAF